MRVLAGRVRELEEELLVMEKEKIELEKLIPHERREGLVESQYISKEEDIDKLVSDKALLEEKVIQYEEEQNELQKHVHIREQYILKLQAQLDERANRVPVEVESQTVQEEGVDASTQTEIVVHETGYHY